MTEKTPRPLRTLPSDRYIPQRHNRYEIFDVRENPCCGSPNLILNLDSEWVCTNCGVVSSPEFINSERRAYNMEELISRRRTEPKWRSFGSRTVISQYNQDANGRPIQPNKKALFSRLNKIQSSLISSIERNFWEAKPKLTTLSNRLGIPNFVQETAWTIYKLVAKQKLTMGRSIESFVAASLYAAIRIHEYPRLMEEVVEASLIPIRSVHKALALIVQKILPGLGLKYKPIRSDRLIYRFGNELNLPMDVQQRAKSLLFSAQRRGLARMGKDPKGLAAAVLYLVSRDTENRRTQSQISNVARITEVTLRTRAKQILSINGIQKALYKASHPSRL